ncbi:MAG: homogentisate 1,2-dioxygenase [Myxococcaceae bacterium]
MDIPWIRGRVAAQAHVALPEGTVEEEYARNGFFGRYAHLYRQHAPVGWTRIEGPLKPRAFDLRRFEGGRGEDWIEGRKGLLGNADVKIGLSMMSTPMSWLYRNSDADELIFVHAGAGRVETDFGPFSYEPGDYVVIPRGTGYRMAPTSPSRFLTLEAFSEISFPEKGMLGQHALFDPAVVQVPTPEASSLKADAHGEFEMRIMHRGQVTKVFYPFNPHDVVGWKGTLAPLKLNVRDIRPVSSDRYHLPPSAHTTFLMRNAVVCSFLPRPLENGDPAALKVPFYHSNIDFDEVLFYHSGEFFSRAGVAPGMLTFHPQGIHHGPQEAAFDRTKAATRTEEVAVMIDTKNPLEVLAPAVPSELSEYWKSWQPKK